MRFRRQRKQGQARIELTDPLGLTRSSFIEDRAPVALLHQINDALRKIEASSTGEMKCCDHHRLGSRTAPSCIGRFGPIANVTGTSTSFHFPGFQHHFRKAATAESSSVLTPVDLATVTDAAQPVFRSSKSKPHGYRAAVLSSRQKRCPPCVAA